MNMIFHNEQPAGDDGESSSGGTENHSHPKPGKKTRGKVKIEMKFIQDKLRRYTTFSKRKTGIMKKAYELSTLTGTQVMLLVASETGHVYTFATKKLQPMITGQEGKDLIQSCLSSVADSEEDTDIEESSVFVNNVNESHLADPSGNVYDYSLPPVSPFDGDDGSAIHNVSDLNFVDQQQPPSVSRTSSAPSNRRPNPAANSNNRISQFRDIALQSPSSSIVDSNFPSLLSSSSRRPVALSSYTADPTPISLLRGAHQTQMHSGAGNIDHQHHHSASSHNALLHNNDLNLELNLQHRHHQQISSEQHSPPPSSILLNPHTINQVNMNRSILGGGGSNSVTTSLLKSRAKHSYDHHL